MKRLSLVVLLLMIILSNLAAVDTVRLKGGTFTMGSPAGEVGRDSIEHQREITLSPFFMGKYEVTQAEYEEIMGTNPSHFKGDKLPVENITWLDAVLFCNKLSERESLTPAYTIQGDNVTWNRNANGYRLPTEAEWEYSCRAGTLTVFNTGDTITAAQANFDGSRPYGGNRARSENRRTTIDVGTFAPNAFGLYDMHGNAAEWCWDLHGMHNADPQTNPAGASVGGHRIFRGGGWNHHADFIRSAKRSALMPAMKGSYLGFRVARNAD